MYVAMDYKWKLEVSAAAAHGVCLLQNKSIAKYLAGFDSFRPNPCDAFHFIQLCGQGLNHHHTPRYSRPIPSATFAFSRPF